MLPDEIQRTNVTSLSRLERAPNLGGDVNITDEDGDTPLYVVEEVSTARWLVEHGAVVDRTNHEGLSVRRRLSGSA